MLDFPKEFSRCSNAIEPLEGTDDLGAFDFAVARGECGGYAAPKEIHKVLAPFRPYHGLRTSYVVIGLRRTPDPSELKRLMMSWSHAVYDVVKYYRGSGYRTSEFDKFQALEDLHFELVNLHPFSWGTGKTARLLLVNHCTMVGVDLYRALNLIKDPTQYLKKLLHHRSTDAL